MLIARFTATVDLPTPPLPLATAIMFFTPGKRSFISFLRVVILESKSISIFLSLPQSSSIASMQSCIILSFRGQASVVKTTVNFICLGLISILSIILRVTKSFLKSGSSTLESVCSKVSLFNSAILIIVLCHQLHTIHIFYSVLDNRVPIDFLI